MRCTLSRALFLATLAILSGQGCSLGSAPLWENFSGEKAFAHVQHLVELGPRPAGSEALEKSRLYIIEQLKSAGWTVARSEFSDQTPRGKMTFVNLIARFGTSEKKEAAQFLLCSHYDTKTFDTIRFVGANDGGSSTGLLIEMALELRDSGKAKSVRGGILFDMIGDKSLDVTLPPDSPADLTRNIFAAADALSQRAYFTYLDRGMTDDHTPLNEIGIPVIDLIDFDFPPWHTAGDTLDKISAESLEIVGRVALYDLVQFELK